MFRRKAYDQLVQWRHERKGRTALLLEGARRVGKTTLAKEFAQKEYRSSIFIDFFGAPDQVKTYFEDYRDNMPRLLFYLSAYYDTNLYERDSLIVFDEVQCFPLARGLIKYLVEDGRYDYLETGSLLSIRQNVEGIVIPSEEERVALNPMDFEEFLWAMGEGGLARLLRAHYEDSRPPDQGLHRKAMRLWREWLLVGGMPKAVDSYVREHSFEAADFEKRTILDLYRVDVSRFARGYESRVTAVFNEIPGQLSKHEKKFTLASVGKSARMRTFGEAFYWLQDAHVANLCYRADDPSVGLALSKERASFKCYLADTGLLVTHTFADAGPVSEKAYRALLIVDIGINEGMLVENAIAQTLVAKGDRLFFYSQSGIKEGEERMEVDFLIARPSQDNALKPKICPVAVKSPTPYRTQHRAISLDRLKVKFGKGVGDGYVLFPGSLSAVRNRRYIPLYMAHLL